MHARHVLALAILPVLASACLNEVEVTPPDQRTPAIQVSSTGLSFTALTGGADPAPWTVTVVNGGGGTLAPPVATVTTADAGGWLSASVDGTQAPYTVTVRLALAALAAGTYSGEVRLESAGARGPRTLTVIFTLRDPRPPAMVLSTSVLGFAATVAGADPAAQLVTVDNGGDLPLVAPTVGVTYDSSASGWLSAAVTGAAPPYTVTVRAATGGLATGTYRGSVDLSAAGAAPVSIVVTFIVSAPRTVTVSRLVTPWTEAGQGTPLPDAAVQSVAIKQDDGAGGLTSVTAAPQPTPGTWAAVVGPGQYWAVITWSSGAQTWVRASVDALDLGEDLAGRADAVRAEVPTEATLDLLALEPWDSLNDALSLVSYGAQAEALLDAFTTPAVPLFDNDVDLFGFAFDWSAAAGPLLAPEDQLWLTQLRFRVNQDVTLDYQETRTFSSLTGVSMSSGTPVALSAPDAQFITGTRQLLLDWQRSKFEAALPPSAPDGLAAHAVTVSAIPARLEAPSPLGRGVPLLLASLGPTSEFDLDFSAGSLDYSTFLPAGWNERFTASLDLDVARTAPGATTPAPGLRDQVFRDDAIAAAPNPVAPLVGGPLSPTIDGADALAAQTGRSTTPTIAWSAPDAGTATTYVVEVHRLAASGVDSLVTPVAQFVLTGTSLAIPPGLLLPGQTYLLRLAARSNPADAGGATPYRKGVPYGEASYWSEPFTTAP